MRLDRFAELIAKHGSSLKIWCCAGRWYGRVACRLGTAGFDHFEEAEISTLFSKICRFLEDAEQQNNKKNWT
jgi:hypothetical protein